MSASATPLLMLTQLYADEPMAALFGVEATVGAWLRVEAALAAAQAEVGTLEPAVARALDEALQLERIDLDRLWADTRVVGYPILPLIRQVAAQLPPHVAGRLHYGATTQDIMDTALALQLRGGLERLRALATAWGDALAHGAERHAHTVMAARTHNQQAVPTTLGNKWASLLDELSRQIDRLDELEPRLCRVSLFGAGGTAAALGPEAPRVRSLIARRLGLHDADVSWHAARDTLYEFVAVAVGLAQTAARFAREISNLSRTEIGEVAEPSGHHRGASSTMPQKTNPITAEAILGLASTARGLLAPMAAAMVVEHERATGEWHVEWDVVPRCAVLCAGAIALAAELTPELRVDEAAMRRNLDLDFGLVMAEACMIRLARDLGQSRAHDVVYAAAGASRRSGRPLRDTLREALDGEHGGSHDLDGALDPTSYLGEAAEVARAAAAAWHRKTSTPAPERSPHVTLGERR